jgi:hypothetical protein
MAMYLSEISGLIWHFTKSYLNNKSWLIIYCSLVSGLLHAPCVMFWRLLLRLSAAICPHTCSDTDLSIKIDLYPDLRGNSSKFQRINFRRIIPCNGILSDTHTTYTASTTFGGEIIDRRYYLKPFAAASDRTTNKEINSIQMNNSALWTTGQERIPAVHKFCWKNE